VPIRLVLADDHPIVLAGLEQLLSLERDFAILARCANGEQAIDAVRRHRPDVLVLDLQMPQKDGLAVLKELHGEPLPTRVVVLTASLGAQDVLDAVRLGARASSSRRWRRICWCSASGRCMRASSGWNGPP
jgi:DNA-binding NarL/FixJ family response regulator